MCPLTGNDKLNAGQRRFALFDSIFTGYVRRKLLMRSSVHQSDWHPRRGSSLSTTEGGPEAPRAPSASRSGTSLRRAQTSSCPTRRWPAPAPPCCTTLTAATAPCRRVDSSSASTSPTWSVWAPIVRSCFFWRACKS